ncbi:hypothetical protein CCACVL1_05398 [Corchorus capsularis]|uniref:Uncharacterized protein n=1 Tax=Corchorus capsularis TaxID=210143 RepID=A0A1R3JKX7_COCAP|nr:hypothetical protein CCACVL1_05398 [Corchorus capsularis]
METLPFWHCREVEANGIYAEMYLKGLVRHLKSGMGTPLRKEGISEVYVYELMDHANGSNKEMGHLIGEYDQEIRCGLLQWGSDSWVDALDYFLVALVWILPSPDFG